MERKTKSGRLSHAEIVRFLCKCDQNLARVVAAVGDIEIRPTRDGFEALARAIIGQQLSVKAAQTIFERVVRACDNHGLTAGSYLEVETPAMRKAGLSARKESFLRGLAVAVAEGFLDFKALEDEEDESIIQRLCSLKGIGRWTAEMHLMFGMNRHDVFPMNDAALQRVMCRVYGFQTSDFLSKGPAIAKSWQPFRSVACRYLYAFGDMKT